MLYIIKYYKVCYTLNILHFVVYFSILYGKSFSPQLGDNDLGGYVVENTHSGVRLNLGFKLLHLALSSCLSVKSG